MAAKLDLHFDPSGGQPIAEIGLTSTHGGLVNRPRLTAPCRNFSDLAQEIRLLHEELNRIEMEARERFGEKEQKAKIRMLALEILAGSKRGDFAPDCFDALADRVSDCLRAEDGLKLPYQLQCEATGAPRREAYLTAEERGFLSEIYRDLLDEGYIALKHGAYNIEATRFVVCPKVPTS